MSLKFGSSFVCEMNRTAMYFTEHKVTTLSRGSFCNKSLLFQQAANDKSLQAKGCENMQ